MPILFHRRIFLQNPSVNARTSLGAEQSPKPYIESVPQDVWIEVTKKVDGKCAEGNPLFQDLSGIVFDIVEVLRETVKEWAHADGLNLTAECNGCNMNLMQWYVDHAHEYPNVAELKSALCTIGFNTGCPQRHNGNHNTDNGLPLTFPVTSEKVYVAELPVKEVCTLCNRTRECVNTKTCKDLSDESVWARHTKDVIISEAWDEELYIDCDSERYDYETGDYVPVPAGSKIDTIHHPEYSNQIVEYLENVDTGDIIEVELVSCRHPKWECDYSDYSIYCATCDAKMPNNEELFN